MPICRSPRLASPVARPLSRFAALASLAAIVAVGGSCINDAALAPSAAASSAAVVVRAAQPLNPLSLNLTGARIVLRPLGFYGDSTVATAAWTGDSAVIPTPVRVVGTSQFFTLLVTAFDAQGDTLLRGRLDSIRLYSVFTIIRALDLSYSGSDSNLTTLRILPRDTSVAQGGSFGMRVTGTDAAGHAVSPIPVTWRSGDATLFTVNASGQVTATAKTGTAYIFATTLLGLIDSTTITVVPSVSVITSTVVTPKTPTLTALGATTTLSAQAYAGAAAVQGTFTWTSRTPSVVTVSSTGVVTAVSNGTSYVVAIETGGTKDSALVTVQAITSTVVTPKTPTLGALGATTTLSAQAYAGAAAVQGTFTWTSRTPSVVTVSQTGVVTAVANGTSYVVAVEAGGTKDSALVTVQQTPNALNIFPATVTLAIGATQQYTFTVVDANGHPIAGIQATDIGWHTDNTAAATISNAGLATAQGLGTANITATLGALQAGSKITVATNIDHIVLSPSPITINALADSRNVTATAYDASNNVVSVGSFTWQSSDPSVASVPGTSGATVAVTSVDNGTTMVTASAQGVTSAPDTVTVLQTLTILEIRPVAVPLGQNIDVAPGGQFPLVARGKDATGHYLRVAFTVDLWQSDDENDIVVDQNGVVTGNQEEIIQRRRGGPRADGENSNPLAHITATAGGITSNMQPVTLSGGAARIVSWQRDTIIFPQGTSPTVNLYVSNPSASALSVTLAPSPTGVVSLPATVSVPIGASAFSVTATGTAAGAATVATTETVQHYTTNPVVMIVTSTVPPSANRRRGLAPTRSTQRARH